MVLGHHFCNFVLLLSFSTYSLGFSLLRGHISGLTSLRRAAGSPSTLRMSNGTLHFFEFQHLGIGLHPASALFANAEDLSLKLIDAGLVRPLARNVRFLSTFEILFEQTELCLNILGLG